MTKFEPIPQGLLLLIVAIGTCHTAVSGNAICNPPCRNGGSCIYNNMCQCPKNFVGNQCQYSVDRCAPHKIGFNGSVRCVGTSTTMNCTLSCPAGIDFDSPPAAGYTCKYETGTFTPSKVPKCVYGEGVEVFRRTVQGDDFGETTCYPSCKNGGSCIFRDMCQCPKDFVGPQCQYSVDRCAPQRIGFNGAIRCSGSSTEMRCTLSCPPGVQFDSPPTTAYTCKYETGTYLPAKVPKCLYGEGVQVIQRTGVGRASGDVSCNPSCMNGGICIFHNLCQCPQTFRGPQCQYSSERCSIKRTGFNGGFRCTGSVAEMSCTIYCPEGTDYEFSPASVYTCKYETGRFMPSTLPKCVAGEGVEIVRV